MFFKFQDCLTFSAAVPPRVELNAKMQKGLKVKAGVTVLLEADVFGKPMPRVTWKRGDDSLKSAEGQVVSQQRHHFQLEMTEVTKEHTGTYTILAENASGSKTAEIQLSVLGEYFSVSVALLFPVFTFQATTADTHLYCLKSSVIDFTKCNKFLENFI